MNRNYVSCENLRNTKDKENRRRSTSCSPYSKNFKPHIKHDQRELISHRQHVKKLLRCELEDKYLALLDENFSIKRENISNHDNIRKLATKVLRLTNDGRNSRITSASKQNLSTEEDLQIRLIDLESYNAQLIEKLSFFIKNNNLNKRSASVATMRASSTSLLDKSKVFRSQDNLDLRTAPSRQLSIELRQFQKSKLRQPSAAVSKAQDTIPECYEFDNQDAAPTGGYHECNHDENEIKDLKELIEKLQCELIQEKSQNTEIVNSSIMVEQMMANQTKEMSQIHITQQKLGELEQEVMQLNEECRQLRQRNEANVEAEHNRIFELNGVLEMEISKNKLLIEKKIQLEAQVDSIDIIKQETTVIQAENELLKQHRDNIASLANELATRNEKIGKLLRNNDHLSRAVSEARASVSALEDCQRDMMEKIQALQDQNDELTVQIEGFRAETKCLAEQKAMLEKENAILRQIGGKI